MAFTRRIMAGAAAAATLVSGLAVPSAQAAGADPAAGSRTAATVTMHRMYNRHTGEHFYTASAGERDSLVRAGWSYEGVGWVAPSAGAPVYRLYNGHVKGGDHHYTTSKAERDSLVRSGWSYEGVGWRSGGSTPVYRQYNRRARTGTHNYTTSAAERDSLVRAGWRAEGTGWYAAAARPSGSNGSGSGSVKPAAATVVRSSDGFAVKSDGSLWAWGDNVSGTKGWGDKGTRLRPVKVLDNVSTVQSDGSFSSFAVKKDGSLWAWGANDSGQLGVGDKKERLTPVKVMDGVSSYQDGYAVKKDGSLWGWGLNRYGDLGVGDKAERLRPVKVM